MGKKQLSASEWINFCKSNPSLSDVITAGYIVNGYPQDDDDDFGTADLSEHPSEHVLDALKYALKIPEGLQYKPLTMRKAMMNASEAMGVPVWDKPEKTCTCGTHKTYGSKIPLSTHSTWCDLRK